MNIFGSLPLSEVAILSEGNIGLWAFELDEGKEPRMYVDDTMQKLIGLKERVSPEETYHAWYDQIDPEHYEEVADAVERMSAGEHAEVQYPWHHPDGRIVYVRCGGLRNYEYKAGIRLEGCHQDVSAMIHIQKESELKAEKYLQTLISAFSGYLEVNLTKNEIISDVIDVSKNGVKRVISVPEDANGKMSFDEFAKYWAKDSLLTNKKHFLAQCNCEYLLSCFHAGQTVVDINFAHKDGEGHSRESRQTFYLSQSNITGDVLGLCLVGEITDAEIKEQELQAVAEAVCSDFDFLSYVNIETDEEFIAKSNPNFEAVVPGWNEIKNLKERLNAICVNVVAKEDKKRFREQTKKHIILNNLRGKPAYFVNFQEIINGKRLYYQSKFTLVNIRGKEYLIVGFHNADKETRQEIIQQNIVNGLSQDYSLILYINTRTEYAAVVRSDISIEDSIKNWDEHLTYNERMKIIADNFVIDEDKEKFLSETSLTNIANELSKTEVYFVNYRIKEPEGNILCWRAKFVKADDSSERYIVAFSNADDEIHKEIEEKAELKRKLDIIDVLALEFTSVFYVNLVENTLIPYSMDETTKKYFETIFTPDITYTTAFRKYVERVVFAPDKLFMYENGSFEKIKSELSNKKEFSFSYRTEINDSIVFNEARFVKIDSIDAPATSIVLAFSTKDREIALKFVNSKLLNEFDAVYLCDIQYDYMREIVPSKSVDTSVINTNRFSELMNYLASIVSDEDKNELNRIANPKYLQLILSKSDRREITYTINGLKMPYRRCTIQVVEYKDGVPISIVMSFMGIDNASAEKLVLDRRIAEQSRQLEEQHKVLLQERSRLSALHEIMKTAKWQLSFDTQYRIIDASWSDDVLETLGYADEAKSFEPFEYLRTHVHPDEYAGIVASFRAAQIDKTGNTQFDTEIRVMTSEGKYKWCRTIARFDRDSNGIAYEAIGVVLDIHAQKEKEILEKQLRNELVHTKLRIDAMSYIITNESNALEFLDAFGARLLDIAKCDQVIFKSADGHRVVCNAPGIENVPVETCDVCPFNSIEFFEMNSYDNSIVINDCAKGWKGIKPSKNCPAKSTMIQCLSSHGKVQGELIVHYFNEYRNFTSTEEETIRMIANYLGIVLERIVSQQELRRETERIAVMHSLINSGMWSIEFNSEREIESVYWSHDFRKYLGYNDEDDFPNVLESWINVLHPEDRDRAINDVMDAFESETPDHQYESEYRVIDKEGVIHWFKGMARNRYNSDGSGEFFGTFVDITSEHRNAELQAVIAGIGERFDFIAHINPELDEEVVFRNEESFPIVPEGWNKITNFTDRIAFIAEKVVHPEDRKAFIKLTDKKRVLKELKHNTSYIVKFREQFGDKVVYYQGTFIKKNISGNELVIAAFGSVDEQTRYEMETQKNLENALNMAQSANRAKTTFLNNMSHDIRTPMNAIIGYTGLASAHINDKEKVQSYLTRIQQSSDHLLSLINDVLDMSRIESGKMNLNEKPENISEIIHTLRNIVHADVVAKNIDFYIDTVDASNETIVCDKLRLNQVLLNILSNAIKYTQAEGTVSLRIIEKKATRRDFAAYEFRIKDNGMGMSKKFLEHIYEPFERVKTSTVSGIQGTGLGMAITKNIVDMMGGTIEINSREGLGTEVVINFEFKTIKEKVKSNKAQHFKSLRALVVDDDINSCQSISKMLIDTGMKSDWCASGKDAVVKAREAIRLEAQYDIYFIDWLMPDMNGIETTKRLRKSIDKDVPIIVLTAYDWGAIEEDAKAAGVTAFVSKPLFPTDLRNVVQNYCKIGSEDESRSRTSVIDEFTNKRVLLVEDIDINREMATDLLTDKGFIVDTAENGKIAVEKVAASKPGFYDVVLMDVQMPVMDGYEATRAIRNLENKELANICIIAMTANAFEEDKYAALEAGMNAHIAKPIRVNVLKETLKQYI